MSLRHSIGVLALLAPTVYLSGCNGQSASTPQTEKAATGAQVGQEMQKAMQKMDPSQMPAGAGDLMDKAKGTAMPSPPGVPPSTGGGAAPKAPGQ